MSLPFSVSYFGLLADRRGVQEEQLDSSAKTPAALYAEINANHPMGMVSSDMQVAVNDALVAWNHPLEVGDHVAFLPPMSGG